MAKTITLKFDGTCRDCGAVLKAGSQGRWYGKGRIYGIGCHDKPEGTTSGPEVGPWPGQRHDPAPTSYPPVVGPRPVTAVAAIIAELAKDTSDSMSDYFGHEVERKVVLAWSGTTRDVFPELRRAAGLFVPTLPLATADKSAEHREKYSMGAGFYLKLGHRDSTGWCVKKRKWGLDELEKLAATQTAPESATETPDPLDDDRDGGPVELTEASAAEWAEMYDKLDGAPESESDR